MSDSTFESYAFVELLGHNQIAGKVTEQTIAGAAFLRVDVPKTSRKEPYTKFYSASAIYSITPCSEEIAQQAAERLAVSAIPAYIVQIPALAEKVRQSPEMIELDMELSDNHDFDDDDEYEPDDYDDGNDFDEPYTREDSSDSLSDIPF